MFAIRAHVICSIALKLAVVAGGTGGYSGVDGTCLAVRRELSFHFHFFLCGRLTFSNYRPSDFCFLLNLISCRPTFECTPIIITPATILILASCSSNMVAEGIEGQASGAVARQRRATLLVLYNIQIATVR